MTKKTDFTRILIETTVRRTLDKIHESPERETRNLVDFGLNFTKGRFQKLFLETTQKMLRNEESAYYTLVKNTVSCVDEDRLVTFGINLGYDGCTKGANTIREIEAQRHFNIPWSLRLVINEKKLESDPSFYLSVLKQGVMLGIHTYLLSMTGDPSKVIPLLKSQPNCAFILFLHGSQITDSFLTEFEPVHNVMISVYVDDQMPAACKALQDARFLYAVHECYTKKDREGILNGSWLEKVLPARPYFAFLIPHTSCSKEIQEEIYSYVISVRDSQKYPLIFMDVLHDSLLIDKVISDDVCMVGFDENGNMETTEGLCYTTEYNLYFHNLEDILQSSMAK